MDKITLTQIEKRYQEYLQLSTLDKLLLKELDTGMGDYYKSDPFRIDHAHSLKDWLDDSTGVIKLSALTAYVLRYGAMLKDSISGVKADIKSINSAITAYHEKIADLTLKLEIANQALNALESHEDK